ncbi:wax ester/triacylglycerol synthase domain-containing protein [Streptomyces sp. NPDC002088]|uniref:wax ester/triacylglycerol synthase domain-containing protein n=1 Tax=Streptomyces sp. NPDC002088 TaxID=3154665 RepID=UPI003323055C
MRTRVAERWGALLRLSHVLKSPPDGVPRGYRRLIARHQWVAAGGFDPAAHIVPASQELEDLLADNVCRSLPLDLPPWRLHVVRHGPESGGFTLALLAHHSLLDGSSLMTLFRLLMDDAPAIRLPVSGRRQPAVRKREQNRKVRDELRAQLVDGQAIPLPPTGEAHPSVALTDLRPQAVRAARRLPAEGRGATLTELLLSSVAGALRDCYGPLSRRPKGSAPVHASVPVDLRIPETAQELGNLALAVRLPLPVDLDAPAARLVACQELAATIPSRSRAQQACIPVLQAAARLGPWTLKALAAHGYSPAYAASACTALKWRHVPCSLAGRPLLRIAALPPLHRPGTANFVLFQTADAFTLSVVSHTRPGDARLLADAVARELDTLADLAGQPFPPLASPFPAGRTNGTCSVPSH